MKKLAALAVVIFATSQIFAQSQPSSPTGSATAETTAAKKEKTEAEPKIPGTTIARKNGTFLGLEVANGKFKLSFYDKNKKPMAPDVSYALARWPDIRNSGNNRSALNPDGMAMIGEAFVRPPYTWTVRLALIVEDGDDDTRTTEHYVVPFRG